MSFDELESRVEKVVSWMSHTLVLVRGINEGTRDLLDKETVYEETELAYRTLLDTTTGLLVILESMIQCLEFEHDEEGEETRRRIEGMISRLRILETEL